VSDWLFFIKEIALKGRTHAFTDVIVADYDTTGISSTNVSLFGQERQSCISELMTTSSTFRVIVEYDKVKKLSVFGNVQVFTSSIQTRWKVMLAL